MRQTLIEHEVVTIQNQVKNGVVSPYAIDILSEGKLSLNLVDFEKGFYLLDRTVVLNYTRNSELSIERSKENLTSLIIALKSVGFKDIKAVFEEETDRVKVTLDQAQEDVLDEACS